MTVSQRSIVLAMREMDGIVGALPDLGDSRNSSDSYRPHVVTEDASIDLPLVRFHRATSSCKQRMEARDCSSLCRDGVFQHEAVASPVAVVKDVLSIGSFVGDSLSSWWSLGAIVDRCRTVVDTALPAPLRGLQKHGTAVV